MCILTLKSDIWSTAKFWGLAKIWGLWRPPPAPSWNPIENKCSYLQHHSVRSYKFIMTNENNASHSSGLRAASLGPAHTTTVQFHDLAQMFSTFVTLWTPPKFQARVTDPTAQGAPASTFRTPGWARTCLIKTAYPNDFNSTKC